MEHMANAYIRHLTAIIDHCLSKSDSELTPSDFGYNELSMEDLDSLFD